MAARAHSQGQNGGTARKPEATAQQAISQVHYSGHDIRTWFRSYYLEDVIGTGGTEKLYVCQHCFKYTIDVEVYAAHTLNFCEYKDQWPGWQCYSDETYEIFEVDGEEHLLFAQNLSLFGKLFIENKSVCFDVSGFIYYLLVESGQIVGFFSKEKLSWDNNNLACILVFPPFQARGNGKKLMAASYAVSRREGRPGGPERPLSEPGRKSYEAYWCRAVAEAILNAEDGQVTIRDICDETFIVAEDVTSVLIKMNIIGKCPDGVLRINKADIRDWIVRTGTDMRPPLDATRFQGRPEINDDSSEHAADSSESGSLELATKDTKK